jgi:hypothetical protein
MTLHSAMTGLDLHQPFHYIQETDPGAIGAGFTWFKKSTKVLSYRNDSNTGWISILASSSVNALPPGTTWTEFLAAYAATDPGDTIELPNDEIQQEAALYGIGSKAIRIRGTGPNSMINMVVQDWAQFGIGFATVTTNPVFFENFTVKHDRATIGGAARILTLVVRGGTYGLHVTNMSFIDITSDVMVFIGSDIPNDSATDPVQRVIDGVYFYNNTVNEWYESVINFHAFRGNPHRNIYIQSNYCVETERHPNGSVSAPYGINIDSETDAGETIGGLLENCYIHGNSILGAGHANSLGVSIKASGEPVTDLCYHNLHLVGNTVENWTSPFQLVSISRGDDVGAYDAIPAFVYVYGNTFKYPGGSITCRVDPAGKVGDLVFFGDNNMYFASGKVGLSLPGTWGPNVVVAQSPPNTDHIV